MPYISKEETEGLEPIAIVGMGTSTYQSSLQK